MILGLLLTGAMMTTAAAQKDPGNPCGHKNGMMFHIDDPMSRNSVTFKSTAPLEDIVGTSNEITGYIQFNPSPIQSEPSRKRRSWGVYRSGGQSQYRNSAER